jgi:hypothetical protein
MLTRSARTSASVSPVMIMGSTKPRMCGRQAPRSARASTPAHCRVGVEMLAAEERKQRGNSRVALLHARM